MFRNEFSKLQRMEQKGGELNGLVEKVLSNFEKKKQRVLVVVWSNPSWG